MKKILTILLLATSVLAWGQQNNPIFGGGRSDGWDSRTAMQNGNAIFAGGTGSGWNKSAFSQLVNPIFTGGEGDGWVVGKHTQAAGNIFLGGESDGWAAGTFLQAGNAIFFGGEGDGWAKDSFLVAGNSIFSGGAGDGWSSTYRPEGPLPVTFLSFTAEKSGNTSLLKWKTAKEENSALFEIERSMDALHFEKIGSVAAAGNSNAPLSYSFTDARPLTGYNYYRLRQIDRDGKQAYTPTRVLVFDAVVLRSIKVFPVPTRSLVTIEMPIQLQNEDVVINLSNAIGMMVQQVRLPKYRASNRHQLNLLNLPSGVYTLQLASSSFRGSQTIIKQ